ncbi:MAG TPA: hypothetical protein ENI73_06955 [Spirochaetes bacterium]|nr:hypothetical protein [Spirochaetota bacterium]
MRTPIFLLILLISSVILTNCDPDDQDNCGKTFTESEANGSINTANDFQIVMSNGCKVTITGTVGPNGTDNNDYFIVNPGSASNIIFRLEWSPNSIVNLYLRKQGSSIIDSVTGNSNGKASITYSLFSAFKLVWVQIGISGPITRTYSLTITGFEP